MHAIFPRLKLFLSTDLQLKLTKLRAIFLHIPSANTQETSMILNVQIPVFVLCLKTMTRITLYSHLETLTSNIYTF